MCLTLNTFSTFFFGSTSENKYHFFLFYSKWSLKYMQQNIFLSICGFCILFSFQLPLFCLTYLSFACVLWFIWTYISITTNFCYVLIGLLLILTFKTEVVSSKDFFYLLFHLSLQVPSINGEHISQHVPDLPSISYSDLLNI